MRAVAYIRVSTEQQTVDNQRPALEAMARARGWDLEWVEETASGASVRPALDALCERARRGEFAAVLVWAVDRLGRNMAEVVNRVHALDAAGVVLLSHQEPWLDTSGPTRSLLLSIFAWVAQQERERLSQRVKAGLKRTKKRLGRPQMSPSACAAAAGAYIEGESLQKCAERYGMAKTTLWRYVKRTYPHMRLLGEGGAE